MSLKSFNGLRLFIEVANFKSFTAAADKLNLTKGAISYQMGQLELRLGFAVFDRQTRGVHLTHKGRELWHAANTAFNDIEGCIDALRESETSQLTVGMSSYFAARWLSPRLMQFMVKHPDINLRLQPMMDLDDFLKEGIDIAIRWGNGSWDDVESEVLFLSPVTPCIGAQLLSTLPQQSVEQILNKIPLLQDRAGSQAWQHWFKKAGIAFKQRHTNLVIPDPSIRLQAVVDGQGIALYDSLAQKELNDHRLVPVTDVSLDNYGYYLVYPKYRLDNPAVQAFRQWISPKEEGISSPHSISH